MFGCHSKGLLALLGSGIAQDLFQAKSAICTDDMGCSLNGECVDGVCDCDKGWRGKFCHMLNLTSADRETPGYRNTSMPTWYGSIIEEEGKFHMFSVARAIQEGPPLDDYFMNSALARLEGPSIKGPFTFQEWTIPRFAHEAHAIRAPDGTILIYGVVGAGEDIPIWPTTECELLYNDSFPFHKLSLQLRSSKSVKGPWNKRTLFQWHAGDANDPFCRMEAPTVAFGPQGEVRMVLNAFPCAPVAWTPEVDHLYLVTAPHWDGEYTRQDSLGPLMRKCPGCGAEDPFVWKSKRGYHLLLHTLGSSGGPAAGSLGFSLDGFNWSSHPDSVYAAEPPYPDSVTWTDGTSDTFYRRQGPSLILDADGQPSYLINGVDIAHFPGCHHHTAWTLMQPIAQRHTAMV